MKQNIDDAIDETTLVRINKNSDFNSHSLAINLELL